MGTFSPTVLQNWETLLDLIKEAGKAEDLAEKKWQDETYRETHFDHVIAVVERWTKNYTKEHLFELGQAMGFPWAPIYSPADVLRNEHLSARGFFTSAQLDRTNSIRVPGLPYKFSSFLLRSFNPPSFIRKTNAYIERLPDCFSQRKPISANRNDPKSSGKAQRPLAGIRILDFTRMLAGPYATRILADLGAEVIKIQSKRTATGAEENSGYYFRTWNRNKRSITLDLSCEEAREIVLKLTAISDVVVENFSPRVMSNWGLSFERLRKVKPDVIMTSISAMGQTGPWRNLVGFGPTFHALSGLVAVMSASSDKPVPPGFAYGDTVAGLYAALATLAALTHRDVTGEGQYIDLSCYEAICTLLGKAFTLESLRQADEQPWTLDVDCGAPEGCYPCLGNDRWCALAVYSQEEWQAFCEVVSEEALGTLTFSTFQKRCENRAELDRIIGEWTTRNSPERIVRLLQKAGIAAGIVQDAEKVAKDNQLRRRGFFVSLSHPVFGQTISDRSPIWFTKQEVKAWKAAPALGEANQYVFSELLGFSDSEIQTYSDRGVIT